MWNNCLANLLRSWPTAVVLLHESVGIQKATLNEAKEQEVGSGRNDGGQWWDLWLGLRRLQSSDPTTEANGGHRIHVAVKI